MNINDEVKVRIWHQIRTVIVSQISGHLSQEQKTIIWKRTAIEVSDSIFPITLHTRVHLREEDFLKNSKKVVDLYPNL